MEEIKTTKESNRRKYLRLRPMFGLSGGRISASGRCRRSDELPVSEEKSVRLFAAVTHMGLIPGLWETSMPYSKINPGHFEINPAYSEMNPVHFKINPAHSKMNPVRFKINPAHSEMNPVHFKINPAHSEMNPVHFKINPAHSKTSPAHFKINPGHPGVIFEAGRWGFISRKRTLECSETKTRR